jgi:hypothetical protein
MLQTYVAITQAINEVENQDDGLYGKRVNEVNPPPPPPTQETFALFWELLPQAPNSFQIYCRVYGIMVWLTIEIILIKG